MDFAYIFDFDGVLVNTMEAHYLCNKIALEEAGVPIYKDQYFSQAGMTGREQIKSFFDRANKSVEMQEIDRIYSRKKELYRSHIDAANSIDCNIELLKMLKASRNKIAIASGCSRESLIPVIEKYNIIVDAIVTAEDVKRGKPNPDLFLCAAERIGAIPENCIVIEDSDAGIEAAKAAGMKAMRFYDNKREE